MMIRVKTADGEHALPNEPGRFLSEILHAHGLGLNQRCGGEGSCGGCTVVLEQGAFTVGTQQVSLATQAARQAPACRTRADSEGCVVQLPQRSRSETGGRIESDYVLPPFVLDAQVRRLVFRVPPPSLHDHRSDLEHLVDTVRSKAGCAQLQLSLPQTRAMARMIGDGRGSGPMTATLAAHNGHWELIGLREGEHAVVPHGLAIDIGTTTVAAVLLDLGTGAVVQKAARYNHQVSIAADVASRISAAKSEVDLERLRKALVRDTLNPIIDDLCHAQAIEHDDICRVSMAGNTVMVHLLLGLPVTNIGRVPFNPVVRDAGTLAAGQIGITVNRQAPVSIAPAIAGYIGGDITADLHATGLQCGPDRSLLVDLGTNCEMVLRIGDRLVCCATPAGPAFEGGGMLQGCRATEGAIERIRIGTDLQLTVQTIGGVPPHGICGSAVIDFIAEGRRCGLLSAAGRMDIAMLQRHQRHVQVEQGRRLVHACVIVAQDCAAKQERVVITEADIAEILQAKAAVFAGIETLLGSCGLTSGQLARIVLAGGFARHIDVGNAQAIGLLPRMPLAQVEKVGNAALAGAILALLDANAVPAMSALHVRPQVVELNLLPDFEGNFINALYLPEPEEDTLQAVAS